MPVFFAGVAAAFFAGGWEEAVFFIEAWEEAAFFAGARPVAFAVAFVVALAGAFVVAFAGVFVAVALVAVAFALVAVAFAFAAAFAGADAFFATAVFLEAVALFVPAAAAALVAAFFAGALAADAFVAVVLAAVVFVAVTFAVRLVARAAEVDADPRALARTAALPRVVDLDGVVAAVRLAGDDPRPAAVRAEPPERGEDVRLAAAGELAAVVFAVPARLADRAWVVRRCAGIEAPSNLFDLDRGSGQRRICRPLLPAQRATPIAETRAAAPLPAAYADRAPPATGRPAVVQAAHNPHIDFPPRRKLGVRVERGRRRQGVP
ncbi:MAG: hypothetical protein IRZ02_02895 [Acidothermus sp.]|nr:hypothetical protein [Acidothermus sp.]